MAIGSIQVSNCCAIPQPPSTTFTRWDLSFLITTTGNFSPQLETRENMFACGGPCCFESFVTSIVNRWDNGNREYVNVNLDHVISGSATWTYSSETINTYDSSTLIGVPLLVYRPGTNVLLKRLTGSDRNCRGRRYFFTNTSASYSSVSPSITFEQSQPYPFCQGISASPNSCGPCYESTTKTYLVWRVSPGAISSSSPSLGNLYVDWINQTNIDITAFRISLTATGAAQGRWDLQCSSGTIRVVSDTGIVREASGSLSSCKTALEVGGYLSANKFLDVTDDALSSDLKDASFTLGEYPCNVDLLFAAKGDYLSPKSGITGWAGVPFGDSNPENDSYENTEEGFRAWLQATRKPGICTAAGFAPCGVPAGGNFTAANSIASGFPAAHYTYLLYPYGGETQSNCGDGCRPQGWQINPGNTTANYFQNSGTPIVNKFSSVMGGPPGYLDKCNSSPWPEDGNYEDYCVSDASVIDTSTSYPAPRVTVTWSRSITGSWNLS